MTKVIAVAGGTGSFGRTLVDELKKSPLYSVIVLARKAPEEQDEKAPVIAVDYGNVAETAQKLASNNVKVIISTISVMDAASGTAQVNLVKAASQSGTVKRFVASEWGAPHTPASPMYQTREDTIIELRKTSLEWTRVANGYFMDYYGYPHVKTYLQPLFFVVDVPNKAAGIPGTGNEVLAFTYTQDVAKFTVASLSLPKWEEVTYIYGEKSTFNKLLALAEEARGAKFDVKYDSVEKLSKGEITELPSHPEVYAVFPKPLMQAFFTLFSLWIIEGRLNLPEEKSLNAKFPEIKTTKLSEIVSAWKGL
ncbi:NAD(P)-binding protein [Trichoderma novae-zelandiae]